MITRDALIWLSRKEGLKDFATGFGFFKKLTTRFVAGDNIDETIPYIRQINSENATASHATTCEEREVNGVMIASQRSIRRRPDRSAGPSREWIPGVVDARRSRRAGLRERGPRERRDHAVLRRRAEA